MDQDLQNTPRSNARRNERDARTLDSPERRRIPPLMLGVLHPALPAPAPVPPLMLGVLHPAQPLPVPGPLQHEDPFQNNFVPAPEPPAYQHLPAHLAQALAQLPPLHRGRGRNQPAMPVYQHLPAHLAQAVAALPPLPARG